MDLSGFRNQMKEVSGRLQGKKIPIVNAVAMEQGCTAGNN